jgi:WD40 repeat protein
VPIALILAILSTGLLFFLIVRGSKHKIILILTAVVAVVSWLIVGAIWVTGRWTFSISINLPNLKLLLYALALTIGAIWLAGLGGKACRRTVTLLLGIGWLAVGVGWWASEWLGILAITMPSMILLVAGLLALPPFVLPVELSVWKVSGLNGNPNEQDAVYLARWKVSTVLGFAYTLFWLVCILAGWLRMDAIAFWAYVQGLLLIFRPAFPLGKSWWYVPFYVFVAYGFACLSIWRLFRGFDLYNSLHLLILVQGLFVITSYTLPLTGTIRWMVWVVSSMLYGFGFLFAVFMGLIARTPTSVFIWILGLGAILRFALPSKGEAGQWATPVYQFVEEQPHSLRARVFRRRLRNQPLSKKNVEYVLKDTVDRLNNWAIALLFCIYGLVWVIGLLSEDLGITWLDAWVLTIGLVAVLMPRFVKPSRNWRAFKALVTYNLGRNLPYYTVTGGAGESGRLVERSGGVAGGKMLTGPGISLSRAEHALVVHDGAGTKPERVFRPGFNFLDQNAKIREAIDLRYQVRAKPTVSVKTKDGIDVNVITFAAFRLAIERAVAVTPDARWAMVANFDGTIQVWNLETWCNPLPECEQMLRAAAVTPDGHHVVAVSANGILQAWDLKTAAKYVARDPLSVRNGACAIAVTDTADRVVIGYSDGKIGIRGLFPGTRQYIIDGHATTVCAVAVTPDGNRIFSASTDGILRVSDSDGARFKARTLGGEHQEVRAVAMTPDGRYGVSASSNGQLRVWNLQELKEEKTLTGRQEGVRALTVTPDSCQVEFISAYGTLRVWDLRTGLEGRTLNSDQKWKRALALTPGGGYVVFADPDGRLWVSKTWHAERALCGHTDWVRALAMTPDARRAVSASSDGTLRVWDLGNTQAVLKLDGHAKARSAAISATGTCIILGYSDGGLKALILEEDLEEGTLKVREERTLIGHKNWVCAVAVTPDGNSAISAAPSEPSSVAAQDSLELKVWNLEAGDQAHACSIGEDWVNAMAITPWGRHAIIAVPDGSIKVVDLVDTQVLNLDAGPRKRHREVRAIAVHPRHGFRFALVCADGSVEAWKRHWNPRTREFSWFAEESEGSEDWRRSVSDPLPRPGRSFPRDGEAILKAVHAQQTPIDEGRKSGWDELVHQRCRAALRDIIAGYNLDELCSLHDPDADPRGDITNRMNDDVRGQIRKWGLHLLGCGIGNLVPPDKAIKQRIEHWQAHLRGEIEILEAEAEADKQGMIERYRAQAERELIESISKVYDSLQDLSPERRQEVIAIRLLTAIERSMIAARDSATRGESDLEAQTILDRSDLISKEQGPAGE